MTHGCVHLTPDELDRRRKMFAAIFAAKCDTFRIYGDRACSWLEVQLVRSIYVNYYNMTNPKV